jgi:NAD(P)-dependent dehydrogenase (short-subunit alcohol dehydrogenase family)
MAKWSTADIPAQSGRTVIITGTGGLGYETALELARKGADVTLAGRNAEKGRASVDAIRGQVPGAKIAFAPLDLASLESVAGFASRYAEDHPSLDLLVNNAGVMSPPQRGTTRDGFEIQFGTNHLAHFALTAHLLPMLRRGARPRVTNVASGASAWGKIDFDDLQWQKTYHPWRAYGQSKLANLLFTFELQRRSDANGWGLMANAAHPGYARTELIPNGPGSNVLSTILGPFMSQTPAAGALPQLFAATSPNEKPGAYYGPDGLFELVGAPKEVRGPKAAYDTAVARRLWDASEQLAGVSFSASIEAAPAE